MAKIYVCTPFGGPIEVNMPDATSIKYAACRAAEACGFDDEDAYWWLVNSSGRWLPSDAIIVQYDGEYLMLDARSFEEL